MEGSREFLFPNCTLGRTISNTDFLDNFSKALYPQTGVYTKLVPNCCLELTHLRHYIGIGVICNDQLNKLKMSKSPGWS